MQTGTKISGAAHLILILGALFGGVFSSDPLPFEVQEVSVLSVEEFEALSNRPSAPVVATEPAPPPAPETPSEPVVETPPVETPTPPVRPEPVTPPQPETPPPPAPEPEPPAPQAEAVETVPSIVTPAEETPPTPQLSNRPPKPRPVDRVAPTPVAPPPPEAKPDEVVREEVTPEASETAEVQKEPQEATAPEAATDQIVTEATETDELAPTSSPRPPARRPQRPAPSEDKPSETAEAKPEAGRQIDTSSAVSDALAAALGAAEQSDTPSGPPLSAGEQDALRVAVSACWNVGALSTEALRTTVVVGVGLGQDGKPDIGSIEMLSSSGGDQAAVAQAFEAARRAIIRCGAQGFALPAEKYDHWRHIEMTFNPERMRIK